MRWGFRLSVVLFILCCSTAVRAQTLRSITDWSVSLDGGRTYQRVEVPGTIEDQIQVDYDGISLYRTELPKIGLAPGQRALLRFAAVATHAKVLVDDQLIAEHLGGWTPFTVDITQFVRHPEDDRATILHVEVDEKVGHNTQGFLPVVTSHFGGIWQPVSLIVADVAFIVRDAVAIFSDLNARTIDLQIPLSMRRDAQVELALSLAELDAEGRPLPWQTLTADLSTMPESTRILGQSEEDYQDVIRYGRIEAPVDWKPWSPESPQRYVLRVEARGEDSGAPDVAHFPFGVRDFHVDGDSLLLNGQVRSIRGLLNWGYAPPSVAPSLDERWMRAEIEFAKARGFNLMKFCLWIPPKRYLELCDQLGMLAWVEYPTWHARLDQEHLAELRREYAEFFEYDRNHPSVVLRSLTCETGPSADLDVIRSLYEQCKAMIPGAVVEDDSSWISWNRIHDFYDDHPYGNNHTWVQTLTSLKEYIAQRPLKPLVLGEAIAADSWTIPTPEALAYAESNPAHGAWAVADQLRWSDELTRLAQSRDRRFDPDLLYPQSVHYGQLMRKFQIEVYQQEVPRGAYVVSVIRDFPKAAMGLIDYANQPKHAVEDWEFHGDRMILLRTERDRRSFESGMSARVELFPRDFAATEDASEIELTLRGADGAARWSATRSVGRSDGETPLSFDIQFPEVHWPQRLELEAVWRTADGTTVTNAWPVWVFPATRGTISVEVHPSAAQLARELPIAPGDTGSRSPRIVLARKLDAPLLQSLQAGARVLLIPDGGSGSFPTRDHWFLRGSITALPRADEQWHLPFERKTASGAHEQNMLVELQHFDLAGPVVPDIEPFWELVDPMVLLWDNHDLREVKTHALAFRMQVGLSGQLLVSTLNHRGATNAAGRWLLEQWLQQMTDEAWPRMDADVGQTTLARLDRELHRRVIPLSDDAWRFRPDTEEQGVKAEWYAVDCDDSQWASIRTDRHWESQGHEDLDQWAWYRRTVEIPGDWDSPTTYLNFTGIDDYADVYVNGEKIASLGDIDTRETAFELRVSLDVSRFVEPGRAIQIAVAVYDWYGAGGIFRPVTLSTEPLSTSPPILK